MARMEEGETILAKLKISSSSSSSSSLFSKGILVWQEWKKVKSFLPH